MVLHVVRGMWEISWKNIWKNGSSNIAEVVIRWIIQGALKLHGLRSIPSREMKNVEHFLKGVDDDE